MAMFYPRKQTVITFVVCAVAVVAAKYYVSSADQPADSARLQALAASATDTEAAIIDSPEFADWQASFGTTTVKKPAAGSSSSPETLTRTDKFSRDFFTRYMELKQAGLLNNQDIVNQATNDVITADVNPTPPKVYTLSDLKISSSADAASLQSFSSAVASVIESYRVAKNEQSILTDFFASNDPSSLKSLAPVIATYKRMIASLLAIRTPRSVSAQQLEIINALSAMEAAATDLQALGSDTIRGLAGISAHTAAVTAMITALTDMHSALTGLGASFDFDQSVLNTMLR
ncbi:MAG: hypothetical protein KGI66_01095 [Patescibacteria group bacterium]|nr:hypothetical protein [Patescibacteria group bacterium]